VKTDPINEHHYHSKDNQQRWNLSNEFRNHYHTLSVAKQAMLHAVLQLLQNFLGLSFFSTFSTSSLFSFCKGLADGV